ncbi:deoxyribose-phosphate aldolase [Brevibacillus centrosporus]|uniref:deoxyribose-phosphate aldolase n=1 Tax=Brevibacillus centrosporus TaxID=54910 RepID=UPI002E24F36C|nr:deoxyribose-phosphate aldolase [Brevibacillus centrosporus]MED1949038.1 deoxyribose-phosphate aldolase [Brevibacillus centrosporus]
MIASYIDHTLLKPEATKDQVMKLCVEAREYGFASVCINPAFVELAASILNSSDAKVCTVVGFPLGANATAIKVEETKQAIRDGAEEIDMVINIGALKAGDSQLVEDDIRAVVDAAEGSLVKVIIETCLLTREEKILACQLAEKAGAHFVKTSTGFSSGGATPEDVALMKEVVGERLGVKASGGVRDLASAQSMIQAGATRIGSSNSVVIVNS